VNDADRQPGPRGPIDQHDSHKGDDVDLSLTKVSLEIDGRPIKFGVYNNNVEYEIDSFDLGSSSISACMRALRNYSRTRTAKQRPRIDLSVELPDSEKAFWEQTVFGIFITSKRSSYDLEFTANAAIGMQEETVREIVSSCTQGTEFSLSQVRNNGTEFPLIEGDGWHGWNINLRVGLKTTSTFDQLLKLRSCISQEIFLPSEKLTSPYLMLRALQSGRVEILLGKPESETLEVKSTAYDLKNVDEAHWKLELAQDVAQFANAPNGGLLLIGYRTKKIDGIDIIQKVTAVQHKPHRLQVYGDILKYRIHPPIGGLLIGHIPIGDNEIIYFYVPAQPEENKPYLISGAFIDDCYCPTGISIVRRQGDASIPVTAQEIHAALVIGRALIQGSRAAKPRL
jgi:hypothetical protein